MRKMQAMRESRPLISADRVLGTLLALGILVGFVLEAKYSPSLPGSTMRSIRDEPSWKWLSGVHYWTSVLLLLASMVQVARLAWRGDFASNKMRWFLTLGTAALAFGFQLTGNLLPFDAHDVQTAVIESSIAAGVPVIGPPIAKLMLGGEMFSAATVGIWHTAHMWVLGIAGALLAGAMLKLSRNQGRFDLLLAIGLPLVAAFTLASPTGRGAVSDDFSAFDAKASWYVWPMHGALAAFQRLDPNLGWLGSAVLPGLLVGFLVLLPWLGPKLGKPASRLTLLAFAAAFAILALGFGGSPAPIAGAQEPFTLAAASPDGKGTVISDAAFELGRQTFNRSGCVGCHGRDGSGGLSGPYLGDYWKRAPDAGTIVRFIGNPTSVKPNSTMPAMPQVPVQARRAIAEWLRARKDEAPPSN